MVKRLLRDDRGITITELSIVILIVALTMGVVLGLFSGFFNNVQFQYDLDDVERESRPVVRELVIQTRQSIARGTTTDLFPIRELAWDKLAFYSDRLPYNDGGAPELHVYELVGCSNGNNGGVCDLQLTVFAPDDPAVVPWTYTGAASLQRIELENVLADAPSVDPNGALFVGVSWTGNPLTQTEVASCLEGSGTPCDFPLIDIHLRVDPNLTKANPRVFELEESVRLRNG